MLNNACFRSGKPTWETKFIVIHGNKLYIYNDNDELTSGIKAIDEFDLCPSNGVVSIQSAVSQTQLVNLAVNDLPFVLMVEFEPDDCNLPNRYFTNVVLICLYVVATASVLC